MEDRRVDHPRERRRKAGGAVVGGVRGEADLIVDDDVHGATGGEGGQLGQHERLVDRALAHERRVAVHEHRDHALAPRIGQVRLLGPDDSFHDGIDGLEVTWIRAHRQVDGASVARHVVVRIAEMVLDVAVTVDVPGQKGPLELPQDQLVRLPQDVREDVQAASVGHTHHHLVHVGCRRVLHQGIEQRDQRLGTLQREALLAHELRVEELLERLGGHEQLEDAAALLRRQRRLVPGALDALLDPFPLRLVGERQVLDAERAAIRAPQRRQQVAERGGLKAAEGPAVHLAVEVAVAEAELVEIEERV